MMRLLQIVLGVALLGAAGYFLDWQALMAAVAKVHPLQVVVLLIVIQSGIVINGFRWHYLIRHVAPMATSRHLRHYFRGVFLNSFAPSNLGGDAYRILALKNHAASSGAMLVAVLRERVIGLLCFCSFYLIFLGLSWGLVASLAPPYDDYAILSAVAVFTVLMGIAVGPMVVDFLHKRAGLGAVPWLDRTAAGVRAAMSFESVGEFLVLLGFSLAAMGTWILAVNLVAFDVGLGLPLAVVGAIAVLTELIRFVPISFQGIGLREGSFALFVGLAGGEPEAGFVVAGLAYLGMSVSLVLAGLIGLMFGADREDS